MINIMNPTERKRKSERLSKDEVKALQKYVRTFPTIIDAAMSIGIHRNVLDLVLIRETGSPETIGKIREKINQGIAA
jgi:hypothetical protein